jgi:CheY-like chemotaxis protein/two-component sensor histidine kinase
MSHEIRTPLNAIIGLSDLELERNSVDPLALSSFERIYRSGTVLLAIINDVLDISKIESGRFHLVSVEYDTASVFDDAISQNMVRIGKKPIVFKFDIDEKIPRMLFGDDLRIRQILNNLLSNAFKYTREGEVSLRIDCGIVPPADKAQIRADDGKVYPETELYLTISDTGIGIKPEDMGKLFSNYNQVDTRSNRTIEGTGLGLSITKQLVEMMGGTVTVKSEYGKGSVFTVVIKQGAADPLPLGSVAAQALAAFSYHDLKDKNFERVQMPGVSVLVVDDVFANIVVARGFLGRYGIDVEYAESGERAVALIREEKKRYDIVFMDHMMPNMDGVEAVRIMRHEIETEYARTVPVVAFTANVLPGTDELFLKQDFQGYLAKPINVLDLDRVLKKLIPQGKIHSGSANVAQFRKLLEDIDIEQGIFMTGGSLEGYCEVLSIFCSEVKEAMAVFGSKGNGEAIILRLHALKDALSIIGALSLFPEMEKIAEADAESLEQYLPDFTARLLELADRITSALALL